MAPLLLLLGWVADPLLLRNTSPPNESEV